MSRPGWAGSDGTAAPTASGKFGQGGLNARGGQGLVLGQGHREDAGTAATLADSRSAMVMTVWPGYPVQVLPASLIRVPKLTPGLRGAASGAAMPVRRRGVIEHGTRWSRTEVGAFGHGAA